jgi:hypothetical protein
MKKITQIIVSATCLILALMPLNTFAATIIPIPIRTSGGGGDDSSDKLFIALLIFLNLVFILTAFVYFLKWYFNKNIRADYSFAEYVLGYQSAEYPYVNTLLFCITNGVTLAVMLIFYIASLL